MGGWRTVGVLQTWEVPGTSNTQQQRQQRMGVELSYFPRSQGWSWAPWRKGRGDLGTQVTLQSFALNCTSGPVFYSAAPLQVLKLIRPVWEEVGL